MSLLKPGQWVVLTLQGSAVSHRVEVKVRTVDPANVMVERSGGQQVRIPREVILNVERPERFAGRPGKPERRPSVDAELARLAAKAALLRQESTTGRDHAGPPPSVTVEEMRAVVEVLQARMVNGRYRRVLEDLHELLELLSDRMASTTLSDAKTVRLRYDKVRRRVKKDLDHAAPSSKVVLALREVVLAIGQFEISDWQSYTRRFDARPHLSVAAAVTLNRADNGEFILPLKVGLDNSQVPAQGIRVVLGQHRGVEVVGNLPVIAELQPGKSQTVHVKLMDRRRQGARDQIRIDARLEYLGPNQEQLRSPQHRIQVTLRRVAAFLEIQNPFREFASGIPVDNPEMFFGRQDLISDILDQLSTRPLGRCYGLFGQKRTGKSSVIEQVRQRLTSSGSMVASISMGVVDRGSITSSFVAEVLDQLREQVAGRLDMKSFESLLTRWPDQNAVQAQPLASFRKACSAIRALTKASGSGEGRIVIIVDEFTYLYELLRRDNVASGDQHQLRDFMRQWKSLLEGRNFSAMVVGQDTMPYFLGAFPNEFSVMHTERLDYLSQAETELLADIPIRRSDDSTRFSGYALSTIYSHTDGHPYFTQIVCDRVVSITNELKRMEISEFEVELAIESLLGGVREIGFHRFDCLLSADNTGVLVGQLGGDDVGQDANDAALRLLRRLAVLGGSQNRPVERDLLELSLQERSVYEDLRLREVVTERDGRSRIRVPIFAEYLRRMADAV